jgi:histidinol-phosphatase (PHP family)
MYTNYHTHSHYCDGKGELPDYITKAKQLGVKALGFSSHAPVPFDCKWCMNITSLGHYLDEIDLLKKNYSEIQLYSGLEIDYIPGKISPLDFKASLDYTIGSIHFVDHYADRTPFEIDGPHIPFLNGLEKIFNSDSKAVVMRYFELTREMIEKSQPTVLGHLDKIKIQNVSDKFFRESDPWYRDEVVKTLDVIKANGTIVEVNTRGLYQKKSATTYPSPWVLELLNKQNIPITVSSDAHHPDDIINQFAETFMLLHSIGFKKVVTLWDGIWQPLAFNEHGYIVENTIKTN